MSDHRAYEQHFESHRRRDPSSPGGPQVLALERRLAELERELAAREESYVEKDGERDGGAARRKGGAGGEADAGRVGTLERRLQIAAGERDAALREVIGTRPPPVRRRGSPRSKPT